MSVKVLHIITQLELGGAQKNCLRILSGLDPKKYEIHLISSDGLLVEEARAIPNLRLNLWSSLARLPNPLLDLFTFFALIIYMKREKISIVHTHSSKAGILGRWAARCARVPVVIHTVHGWGFHELVQSLFNDIYIFLERSTAKITTKLIAVSVSDIEKGLSRKIGTSDQYVFIRCGIDPDFCRLQPDAVTDFRRSLGVDECDKVVGMVACLKPQKNPVDFVKAAALVSEKNPGTKFFLIGDGILRKKVEREVALANLSEDFFVLGWRKDMSVVMSALDVVVLTSLWEGLPIVFFEAMACAKPIVAYDICGNHEIVKNGVNGFLETPRDVSALASKIGSLLDNEEFRIRMGAFGQRIVASDAFSSQTMVRRIQGLYEELIQMH
jgi:glycosyltransferase involved in cell wall biosynthesis